MQEKILINMHKYIINMHVVFVNIPLIVEITEWYFI